MIVKRTKEETEVDITIDITRGIDPYGIARRYYPTIHWTLDEQDSISPDTMRKIADNVKFCVEGGLRDELNNSKLNSERI